MQSRIRTALFTYLVVSFQVLMAQVIFTDSNLPIVVIETSGQEIED